MIDIVAIKKSLTSLISQVIPPNDMKADGSEFPYTVYKLPSSGNGEKDNSQNLNFTLEIHIWDKNSDSSNIERLCSDLNNLLDGKDIIESTFYYRIDRISPYIQVPDPVDDIQHRIVSFLVKVQFL